MKIKFITIAILLIATNVFSQNFSSLKITSTDGQKFKLFLNKELINQEFQSEVFLQELEPKFVKIRIEFENAEIKPVKDFTNIQDFSDATYLLKPKKNGKYKLKLDEIIYYRPNTPCVQPVEERTLAELNAQVASQANDLKRNQVAREIVSVNCMSFAQIKTLAFHIENQATRDDFLRYAYFYAYDPQNYSVIFPLITPAQQAAYELYVKKFK